MGDDALRPAPHGRFGKRLRTRRLRWLLASGLAVVLMLTTAARAPAQTIPADLPILFTADEVVYDRERDLVVATGNIEASHGDRTLIADRLVYDQTRNVLTVEGNIALIEATGEVLFADRMELADNLEAGMIENVRALLSDGARFAATGGRRVGGNRTEMRKAVYSPCFLCPDDPERPPLWQIKAFEMVHDQEARRIDYSDAFLEFAGVPILYTPFLSHPDPTVKRKTGFLVPGFGNSSDLGFIFSLPFYWVIDDDKDATITPIYTSKEGPVLALEYRQALMSGTFKLDGSVTVDSEDDFRGHVFSELRHEINDTWRMGIDFNRTTDDTYLRRYDIADPNSLTSQIFAEGFRGRNYLRAGAFLFQNLEDDPTENEPIVLPLIDFNHVGQPDPIGGNWTLDLDASAVTREDGPDYRRLSARAGYDVPLRDTIGSLYTLSAALWADGYQVQTQPIPGQPGTFTGITGRIFPQASAQWRFPLVRKGERLDQVVEPIVEIVVAPNGGNPQEIPNEDSQNVELDTSNVFGLKRFPGLDRVESGSRLNYGLQWQLLDNNGGQASVFVGQVYRLVDSTELDAASGLKGKLSNLVAGANITFPPYFSIRYSSAYDVRNARFRRNEVAFGGGVDALSIAGTYVFFRDDPNADFPSREELQLGVNTRLTRYWRARAFGTGDLAQGGGLLRFGTGLTYEDECFLMDASWTREEFEDRDLQPSDTFFVRVALKTLGDVGFGF